MVPAPELVDEADSAMAVLFEFCPVSYWLIEPVWESMKR